jgi:beta-propeller repeat-containing protein
MRQASPRLGAWTTSLVVALVVPVALLHAQRAQVESWARQFGTARFDQANGIAVADFNVYVAGDAIGALPGQVSEFPQEVSGFVRKYDSKGTVVWTQTIGSTTEGEDHATSVAANTSGVYVAGWTAGSLPGQTKSGPYDAFVRKYDVNGNEQWTRQFGTTATVEAFGVAVDGSGVYVAGRVDCCNGPFPGIVASTGADAFLRKYDLDGKQLWTRQFGSPDVDRATAIAVDATGVYVAGMTNGEFAGPRGQQDGFLVRFDADGTVLWSRQFGTTDQNEETNVVAVGPSGAYVGGRTTGALQGDKPRGLWDAYVMQFDRDGMLQWARQFGGAGDGDNVFGLAVGLTHLLVTGAADGELPGQTFVGGQDAFYRLYDFTGAEAGTREFGNGLNDFGGGAAADARAFYIAGTKNGAALSLTPIGDNDAFVMKMAPKPLEKEDVKIDRPPARRGAGGGARGGRAGRAGN